VNASITGGDFGAGFLSGGLSGGIGAYFGNSWSVGRVASESVVGGTVAEINGGKFADGAIYSAGHAMLSYGNYAARKYELVHTPYGSIGKSPGALGLPGKLAGMRPWSGGRPQPLTGAFIFGGNQGSRGFNRFFGGKGFWYSPGSTWDFINESFAGIHDFLNGRVFQMYNQKGIYIGGFGKSYDGAISIMNVIPSAPIAIASMIPPYALSK
jgi:hypothetical protein